jgi:hypothetical protein
MDKMDATLLLDESADEEYCMRITPLILLFVKAMEPDPRAVNPEFLFGKTAREGTLPHRFRDANE